MNNFKLRQTGPEVQEILDRVPINTQAIATETERATGAENGLQEQINAIIASGATIALTASPTAIFVARQTTVTLKATCDVETRSITIRRGDEIIATGTGKTLTTTVVMNEQTAATTTFTAEFDIAGITKTKTVNVASVHPIYYGAGATPEAASTELGTAKTTPAGTYTVRVNTAGSYVFFNVPATMTIKGATMSGFAFPLDAPTTISIGGVSYKSYRSSNTYDTGTLTIVLT